MKKIIEALEDRRTYFGITIGFAIVLLVILIMIFIRFGIDPNHIYGLPVF